MVKNPFITPEYSDPKITEAVNAAYNQTVNDGTATDAGGDQPVDLEKIVEAETSQFSQDNPEEAEPGKGFESIADPEAAKHFELSFQIAKNLFSSIDLKAPTVEEFVRAGVQFDQLAKEYKAMKKDGLQPQLIITPTMLLAKDKEHPEWKSWESLYTAIANDKNIPFNKLSTGLSSTCGDGLSISENIVEVQDGLLVECDYVCSEDSDIHVVNLPEDGVIRSWTISVVPAQNEAQKSGSPLGAIVNGVISVEQRNMMWINQYLCLQAVKAVTSANMVDEESKHAFSRTVLRQVFDDKNGQRRYMTARYDAATGIVEIEDQAQEDEAHIFRPDDGIRQPVYG